MINNFMEVTGINLPEDYINFLLESNGGEAEPNFFDDRDLNYIGVSEFFGLEEKKEYSLLKQKEFYSYRVPKDYLPIASASGGNLICLGISEDKFGQIFFWDHENEVNEGETPWEKNIVKVIDTFSQFLHSLKKIDPNSIELKQDQIIEAWIDPDLLEELNNNKN